MAPEIRLSLDLVCIDTDDSCTQGDTYELDLVLRKEGYTEIGMTCIEEQEGVLLGEVAKELGVASGELKVRYIGGQPFDGDMDGDEVVEPSIEFFDIFLAEDDMEKDEPLTRAAYGGETRFDTKTDEVYCDYEETGVDHWDYIYDTYL